MSERRLPEALDALEYHLRYSAHFQPADWLALKGEILAATVAPSAELPIMSVQCPNCGNDFDAGRQLSATPSATQRRCPYCTSDNEGIRSTYYDQTCEGCVRRMVQK